MLNLEKGSPADYITFFLTSPYKSFFCMIYFGGFYLLVRVLEMFVLLLRDVKGNCYLMVKVNFKGSVLAPLLSPVKCR